MSEYRLVVSLGFILLISCGQSTDRSAEDADVDARVFADAGLPLAEETALHGFSKLLWVGAHPDDEIPSSPLLRLLCERSGTQCFFVSLTSGESGSCEIAGGCLPTLASVRESEYTQMGQYMNGSVTVLDLADGAAGSKLGVLGNWALQEGGETQLLEKMKTAILAFGPDAVLTLDPRHGTTCHPDHRAAGELALQAAVDLGYPRSALFVVESVILGVGGSTTPGFQPAVLADENVESISVDGSWMTILDLMGEVYKSQYTAQVVQSVLEIPIGGRTVSILSMNNSDAEDSRYQSLCP